LKCSPELVKSISIKYFYLCIGKASLDVLLCGKVDNLDPVQEFLELVSSFVCMSEPSGVSTTSRNCAHWRKFVIDHLKNIASCQDILSELCNAWDQYIGLSPKLESGLSGLTFFQYLSDSHASLLVQLISVVATLDILGGQVIKTFCDC
jgi:hypothetical protein